eukprot:275726-Pyramimonas_sp.AAC.1
MGAPRGLPSLLRRERLSTELDWPAWRREFRCRIPGWARCLLHLPASALHGPGNWRETSGGRTGWHPLGGG